MEQESINNTKFVFHHLPLNLLLQITSFLNEQDLRVVAQAKKNSSNQKYKQVKSANIASLASDKIFVSSFLNRTDRSVYMVFYEDYQFKRIEQSHLRKMYISMPNIFCKQKQAFQTIFDHLQDQLSQVTNGAEITESIKVATMDPQLPFPKMRKQGVGIFCNSPFQFHLIDLRLQQEEPFLEECFQDLKNFIETFMQERSELQLEKISESQELLRIFHKVRYASDTLTPSNFQHFLIKNDVLNNLVVLTFALTSNLVDSYNRYVKSFHDPFAFFVEFTIRYNIFRNFVLDLQEKMCFLFQKYNQAAEQILGEDQNEPAFCFWRPAMTIWYQTMKQHHELTNQVYLYALTKIRGTNLRKFIEQELLSQFPSAAVPMINRLEHKQFELQSFHSLNTEKIDNLGMQGYFQKNSDLYEQILRDYMEYIMDISVNQLTVHWCGHSSHTVQQPYIQFEDYFLEVNQEYYKYLTEISFSKRHGIQEKFIFQKILQKQIDFLGRGFIKPLTLKKMVERSNQLIVENCQKGKEGNSESLQSTNNSFYTSQGVSPLNINKIQFSNKQQDKKLDYYNEKYKYNSKAKNLPDHSQLNYSQRMFFSIASNSQSKLLVKSMDVLTKSIQMRVNKSAQNGKEQKKQSKIDQIVQYFSKEVQQIQFDQDLNFNIFGKTESVSENYIQHEEGATEQINQIMAVSVQYNEQQKNNLPTIQNKFNGLSIPISNQQFMEKSSDEDY